MSSSRRRSKDDKEDAGRGDRERKRRSSRMDSSSGAGGHRRKDKVEADAKARRNGKGHIEADYGEAEDYSEKIPTDKYSGRHGHRQDSKRHTAIVDNNQFNFVDIDAPADQPGVVTLETLAAGTIGDEIDERACLNSVDVTSADQFKGLTTIDATIRSDKRERGKRRRHDDEHKDVRSNRRRDSKSHKSSFVEEIDTLDHVLTTDQRNQSVLESQRGGPGEPLQDTITDADCQRGDSLSDLKVVEVEARSEREIRREEKRDRSEKEKRKHLKGERSFGGDRDEKRDENGRHSKENRSTRGAREDANDDGEQGRRRERKDGDRREKHRSRRITDQSAGDDNRVSEPAHELQTAGNEAAYDPIMGLEELVHDELDAGNCSNDLTGAPDDMRNRDVHSIQEDMGGDKEAEVEAVDDEGLVDAAFSVGDEAGGWEGRDDAQLGREDTEERVPHDGEVGADEEEEPETPSSPAPRRRRARRWDTDEPAQITADTVNVVESSEARGRLAGGEEMTTRGETGEKQQFEKGRSPWSAREELRQELEREKTREQVLQEYQAGAEHEGGDPGPPSNENHFPVGSAEWRVQEEMRNTELERELEKRIRRRREDPGDRDRWRKDNAKSNTSPDWRRRRDDSRGRGRVGGGGQDRWSQRDSRDARRDERERGGRDDRKQPSSRGKRAGDDWPRESRGREELRGSDSEGGGGEHEERRERERSTQRYRQGGGARGDDAADGGAKRKSRVELDEGAGVNRGECGRGERQEGNRQGRDDARGVVDGLEDRRASYDRRRERGRGGESQELERGHGRDGERQVEAAGGAHEDEDGFRRRAQHLAEPSAAGSAGRPREHSSRYDARGTGGGGVMYQERGRGRERENEQRAPEGGSRKRREDSGEEAWEERVEPRSAARVAEEYAARRHARQQQQQQRHVGHMQEQRPPPPYDLLMPHHHPAHPHAQAHAHAHAHPHDLRYGRHYAHAGLPYEGMGGQRFPSYHAMELEEGSEMTDRRRQQHDMGPPPYPELEERRRAKSGSPGRSHDRDAFYEEERRPRSRSGNGDGQRDLQVFEGDEDDGMGNGRVEAMQAGTGTDRGAAKGHSASPANNGAGGAQSAGRSLSPPALPDGRSPAPSAARNRRGSKGEGHEPSVSSSSGTLGRAPRRAADQGGDGTLGGPPQGELYSPERNAAVVAAGSGRRGATTRRAAERGSTERSLSPRSLAGALRSSSRGGQPPPGGGGPAERPQGVDEMSSFASGGGERRKRSSSRSAAGGGNINHSQAIKPPPQLAPLPPSLGLQMPATHAAAAAGAGAGAGASAADAEADADADVPPFHRETSLESEPSSLQGGPRGGGIVKQRPGDRGLLGPGEHWRPPPGGGGGGGRPGLGGAWEEPGLGVHPPMGPGVGVGGDVFPGFMPFNGPRPPAFGPAMGPGGGGVYPPPHVMMYGPGGLGVGVPPGRGHPVEMGFGFEGGLAGMPDGRGPGMSGPAWRGPGRQGGHFGGGFRPRGPEFGGPGGMDAWDRHHQPHWERGGGPPYRGGWGDHMGPWDARERGGGGLSPMPGGGPGGMRYPGWGQGPGMGPWDEGAREGEGLGFDGKPLHMGGPGGSHAGLHGEFHGRPGGPEGREPKQRKGVGEDLLLEGGGAEQQVGAPPGGAAGGPRGGDGGRGREGEGPSKGAGQTKGALAALRALLVRLPVSWQLAGKEMRARYQELVPVLPGDVDGDVFDDGEGEEEEEMSSMTEAETPESPTAGQRLVPAAVAAASAVTSEALKAAMALYTQPEREGRVQASAVGSFILSFEPPKVSAAFLAETSGAAQPAAAASSLEAAAAQPAGSLLIADGHGNGASDDEKLLLSDPADEGPPPAPLGEANEDADNGAVGMEFEMEVGAQEEADETSAAAAAAAGAAAVAAASPSLAEAGDTLAVTERAGSAGLGGERTQARPRSEVVGEGSFPGGLDPSRVAADQQVQGEELPGAAMEQAREEDAVMADVGPAQPLAGGSAARGDLTEAEAGDKAPEAAAAATPAAEAEEVVQGLDAYGEELADDVWLDEEPLIVELQADEETPLSAGASAAGAAGGGPAGECANGGVGLPGALLHGDAPAGYLPAEDAMAVGGRGTTRDSPAAELDLTEGDGEVGASATADGRLQKHDFPLESKENGGIHGDTVAAVAIAAAPEISGAEVVRGGERCTVVDGQDTVSLEMADVQPDAITVTGRRGKRGQRRSTSGKESKLPESPLVEATEAAVQESPRAPPKVTPKPTRTSSRKKKR